ncbi:AAA family ATPase [Pseudomonas mandelii]
MHGLTQIHIQNFWTCKNVYLSLGSFTPLVGQNNVGKSTVLDAI